MSAQTYTDRYEIKYLVPAHRLPEIEDALRGYLTRDANGAHDGGYYIHSIYFDSFDYRFYTEKHEGQLSRIKPRLRSYRTGPGEPNLKSFIELKGRHDKIVAKRRAPVSEELAALLLADSQTPLDSNALGFPALAEFHYLAHRFSLSPSCAILYHRTAHFGTFYPNVRVTFDRLIQSSLTTTLESEPDDFGFAVPPDEFIFELKYNNKVPALMLGLFHELGLEQHTLSKYAMGLESCFERLTVRRAGRACT